MDVLPAACLLFRLRLGVQIQSSGRISRNHCVANPWSVCYFQVREASCIRNTAREVVDVIATNQVSTAGVCNSQVALDPVMSC